MTYAEKMGIKVTHLNPLLTTTAEFVSQASFEAIKQIHFFAEWSDSTIIENTVCLWRVKSWK